MRRSFYVLVLLFLCFMFVLNLKSVSYAWSFDDFQEFCTLIKDGKISASNNQKVSATYFLDNVNNIKNYYTNYNEYTDFIIVNDSYPCFEMYKGGAIVNTSGTLRTSNFNTVRRMRLNYNSISDNGTTSYINTYSWDANYAIGLMQNVRTDKGVWGDKFAWIIGIENPNYFEIPLPALIAQAYTGGTYSNVTFTIQDQNNSDIEAILLTYERTDITSQGSYWDIFLNSDINMVNGNTYHIKMNYGNNYILSEDIIISWQEEPTNVSSGTITNLSGDTTGYIDLSGIESSLSDINNSIISGDAAIIETIKSGDSFWRQTYDSLFAMDSGDVNDVYLMVSSYFPSGETPISIYDTIFGSFSNEPDDFIIRWDDHPLNFTWFGGETLYSGDFIKAGSMNFSKECRDNVVLGLIKFWVNTLFTIFIFIAYYRMLYKYFMDMLGVVSEDIPIGEEEHRPIGFGRN